MMDPAHREPDVDSTVESAILRPPAIAGHRGFLVGELGVVELGVEALLGQQAGMGPSFHHACRRR